MSTNILLLYLGYILYIKGLNAKTIYFNEFKNEHFQQDYEILKISKRNHPFYSVNAFGLNLTLHLKPNRNLISNDFQSKVIDGNNINLIKMSLICHYLYNKDFIAAAFDLCDNNKIYGIIFLESCVIEIIPMISENNNNEDIAHLITRTNVTNKIWKNIHEKSVNKYLPQNLQINKFNDHQKFANEKRSIGKNPSVEIGLFLDEAGYNIFAPYFKNDNTKLRDMLLAYINAVQALYHHPSAGIKLDLVLINLEIFQKQPKDLPDYSGERTNLLDSFCVFNEKHNSKSDNHPKHWDIGVYLSGLDFYAVENGAKNSVTMGLSAVGGVCTSKYSCVIAELGTTNILGKPYPSAGFTSVYVLAHEIGHNLGMHHDSSGNNCPKDGYIMSPSRGVAGETLWSTCSAQILTKLTSTAKCLFETTKSNNGLNHMKFKDKPGMIWGTKKQCEILLKDRDAKSRSEEKLEAICQSLQCETKHKSGVFFAGPALEGTNCGKNKWCHGGECIKKN